MFTEKEQMKINEICQSNPEFLVIVNRFHENQKYLLSRISHELRDPIALIYSTLQLMENKYPDMLDIKYWNNLITDIKEVNALLDEVTTYNQCETLNKMPLEMNELVELINSIFTKMQFDKDITFSIDVDDTLMRSALPLYCDRVKLKQVFTNLLKNAIEAIEQKGFINIALKRTQFDDLNSDIEYLEINVKNNGIPIPNDLIPTIFQPFVTYKEKGTGIGLPLSSRIIESHNGTISVDTENDLTCFKITLPFNFDPGLYQADRISS